MGQYSGGTIIEPPGNVGPTTAGPAVFPYVTDASLVTSDVTVNNVTTAKHGFAPKLPGNASLFWDGTGNFSTPPSGTGTVTSVSVVTANGVSGSVATATTTPAITLSLGAITPSTVTIGAGAAITSSGAGGALGSNAFTSTAFVPTATTVNGHALSGNVTVAVGDITNAASTASSLAQFAATTSAQLAGVLSDETGTGVAVFGTNPTLTGATIDSGSLILQGNQSAAAWTTNGLRIKGISGTLTDTTSTGTVAKAYTNKLGGNTIAATSATTFTDYISGYFSEPVQGTNVTLTNKWGLGADSLYVGTSNPLKVTSAGVLTATSPVFTTPDIGTPSAGVVTNLTGTASININGTVGAGTPAAGTFTTLTDNGNLTFGTSASVLNGTTGSIGITATGTNQNITLTPSGTGWVKTPGNASLTAGYAVGTNASFSGLGAKADGTDIALLVGGSIVVRSNGSSSTNTGFQLPNGWINLAGNVYLKDNASGVLEINNGTAGTFRDLTLRNQTFSGNLLSTTALATPSALSATQSTMFASAVSGASIMGFGTTNDVSLMNRAGTVVLGVGPNNTAITTASTVFASLPSAGSNAGAMARASDLGPSGFGSLWISNGTRWSPMGGTLQLAKLGAKNTGIANSETVVLQTLIPAGAWQTNDTIRIWLTLEKSGTTDALVGSVRIGTAGTTADTAVISAVNFQGTSFRSSGHIYDIKLTSATTAQLLGGANSGSTHSYGPDLSAAVPTAVTISSASSNALYISVTIKSSSTNDTVGIDDGSIQLVTP